MATVGDVVDGRYRLVKLLGQGGMSDVYEALDQGDSSTVALKMVRSSDPELGRRLAQEVRALALADHPSMVRLLGSGESDGQSYLVMEMVDGPTLAEKLREGPLGPRLTALLGSQLADALSFVHRKGVIHRDVKPSNILLGSDGVARLSDFGVARLLDDSTLTLVGTTLGTAAYMAPEQLENHKVGASADVWSLGMVLLECLTGQRTYEGTPSEIVAQRMAGSVPLTADLPVAWRLLFIGMLDERPEQRLESSAIAELLATAPFSVEWSPSDSLMADQSNAVAVDDETSVLPARPSAATLLSQETQIILAKGKNPSRSSQPRSLFHQWTPRFAVMAAVAVLVAGLVAGLVANALTQKDGPIATTSAPTTSIATTTTSVASTGASALGVLTQDIATAVIGGTLDPSDGQTMSNQCQQAITDAAQGNSNKATSDLQQASMIIGSGLQNGTISASTGALLQRDLSTLASALGISSTSVPTTTISPPPSPGPGHGHGHGNGN